jgi:hypothetical protein
MARFRRRGRRRLGRRRRRKSRYYRVGRGGIRL